MSRRLGREGNGLQTPPVLGPSRTEARDRGNDELK